MTGFFLGYGFAWFSFAMCAGWFHIMNTDESRRATGNILPILLLTPLNILILFILGMFLCATSLYRYIDELLGGYQ